MKKCLVLLNFSTPFSNIVPVQSPGHVQLFVIPWTAAYQASLSFTISWSLSKFMSVELVMSSNHLILCCPLLFYLSLSQHQSPFQWISSFHQVAKDWNFSFSISPSNEYSGLISFRIDLFDLLAVQGTLKILFQYFVFFMVQLISIHEYWKHHSLHYMDLCQQSDVFAF